MSRNISVKRNRDWLFSFSLQSVGGRQHFFNQLILLFNISFNFSATLFCYFYFLFSIIYQFYIFPRATFLIVLMLTCMWWWNGSLHLCPFLMDSFVCFGFISCKIIPSVMQPISLRFSPVRTSRGQCRAAGGSSTWPHVEVDLIAIYFMIWVTSSGAPQSILGFPTSTHTRTHTHFAEVHKLDRLPIVVTLSQPEINTNH